MFRTTTPGTVATMDFPGEDPKSAEPMGPLRHNMSNTVNPGKKGSHGFLQKLFSRRPSIPKLVTAGLEDQVTHSPFDSAEDSRDIDIEVMVCPYIRPLGNRLEPRVESAPIAPRRPLPNSAMSISRKKGEVSGAARSYLFLDKAYSNLSESVGMSLRSSTLREEIAGAATADYSHLKEWDCYIKCYSEVRLCTSSYVRISDASWCYPLSCSYLKVYSSTCTLLTLPA
jgi:hypothetical protein